MNRRYFGTDGVRGPYGGPVVNEAFARRLGMATGRWLTAAGRQPPASAPAILIGRDTRASGAALATALAAGFAAAGWPAQSLGILPTPAVARTVRTSGAALGAVITASHNPAADNGIKFFGWEGRKLSEADEAAIEALLAETSAEPLPIQPGPPLGAVPTALADYIGAVGQLLPAGALRGWRIVLDTANGATSAASPAVLRALGAEVLGLGDAPDGANINAGVGSEHPEAMAARVRASGARLGIAHDGDGDRCILCDEKGAVLDGDEILTLLARWALAQGQLAAKTLVVTVHSNLGVDAALAAAGGRVVRAPVGDRYVAERMAVEKANMGGESSGHIIFSDISWTGDGLVAALKVMEVMRATGQPLSELRGVLKKFPQASTTVKVREKIPLGQLPMLTAAIRQLETDLGEHGRVLVRYSGTEPVLRLLAEGPAVGVVQAGLARLVAAAQTDLA
jgi:phosphoglucosamine mutase